MALLQENLQTGHCAVMALHVSKMMMQVQRQRKLSCVRHSHLGAQEASLWAPLKAEKDRNPGHTKDPLFFPPSSFQHLGEKNEKLRHHGLSCCICVRYFMA